MGSSHEIAKVANSLTLLTTCSALQTTWTVLRWDSRANICRVHPQEGQRN